MELEAALREEVRETARVLAQVLEHTRGASVQAVATIRAAAEGGERARDEAVSIAIVGDAVLGRRALLDTAIGSRVFGGGAPPRDRRVTLVRRGDAIEYEARTRDMRRIVRFSVMVPDRGASFDERLAQAERDLAEARAEREAIALRVVAARAAAAEADVAVDGAVRELARAEGEVSRAKVAEGAARDEAERCDAIMRRTPTLPAVHARRPPWWAFWLWLWRLILWPFVRERVRAFAIREAEQSRAIGLLASRTREAETLEDTRRARERAHADAVAKRDEQHAAYAQAEREEQKAVAGVADAEARIERARRERTAYVTERRAKFFEQIRAFDRDDLAELVVELPATELPRGIALVDLPSLAAAEARAFAESADAFVFVADVDRPPTAATTSLVADLARTMPRLGVISSHGERLMDAGAARALVLRSADERALIAVTRRALRLRAHTGDLSRARAQAETAHARRLAALESQRIPDPEQFRAAQLERMESAVASAADATSRSAVGIVQSTLGALREEWAATIGSATSRAQVEAVAKAIQASADARFAEAMEKTSEHVAGELQTHAESLETWALEEIHARYQVTRRFGAEVLAPVASELTREDLELGLAPTIEGAMQSFERQRVRIGLGGVAAGAALGTLIAPGIGTAIGAFLGVFAGFFKGVDSLKQDCLSKIDACFVDTERHAIAQLEAKRPDLARVLRVALDEALKDALGRLERAISRLMELERKAIEGERAALEALRAAQPALEKHDATLGRLVDDALARIAAERRA